MRPLRIVPEDSESEDDPDYVPPAHADDVNSSDGDRNAKRVRTSSPLPNVEDEEAKKRARAALWDDFQARVSTPAASSSSRPAPPKLVKIEKRHLYAGEEVVEIKDVPEDSEEAKKWPRWVPPPIGGAIEPSASAPEEKEGKPAAESAPSSSSQPPAPAKPTKRPGPRKPKTKLTPAPTPAKAKKLTTLDKSAMDWKSHVTGAQDSGLKDELDANRRGGGYLEKVDFLQRVEERKNEAFEANKSTKRRRG